MADVNTTAPAINGNSTLCPSIDDFRNQVYSTSYSVITVLGLVGNGLALVVLLLRSGRQSSPFLVYMVNLAVSDLLCVSTLPLRVHYYVSKGDWRQGDFLCRISSYALYVNLYCSIYFMAAMSVTRFLAIVFPVRNLRLVTVRRARMVCAAIWFSICLASSPFLLSGQSFDAATNKTKCFEPPQGQKLETLVMLNYISLVMGFGVPFTVILLCNSAMVWTLLTRRRVSRQQQQQEQQERRQRGGGSSGARAIRMIVIVLLTFLVSFMPYHVQRTVHLSTLTAAGTTCAENVAMQKLVVVTLCLAASNSCFDPLLYFFSGENFRRRLTTLRGSSRSSSVRPTTRRS